MKKVQLVQPLNWEITLFFVKFVYSEGKKKQKNMQVVYETQQRCSHLQTNK